MGHQISRGEQLPMLMLGGHLVAVEADESPYAAAQFETKAGVT